MKPTQTSGEGPEVLVYGEDPSVATGEGVLVGGPTVRSTQAANGVRPEPPRGAPQTKPKRSRRTS